MYSLQEAVLNPADNIRDEIASRLIRKSETKDAVGSNCNMGIPFCNVQNRGLYLES